MRKSYLIPLILLLTVVSCSEEKSEERKIEVQKSDLKQEPISEVDTIWDETYQCDCNNMQPIRIDTSYQVMNQRFFISLNSRPLKEEFKLIHSWEKDGDLHAFKAIGKNVQYSIVIRDSNDHVIASNIFDKNDLAKLSSTSFLAETEQDRWYFEGYHPEFRRFFFVARYMVPDSDVGVEQMVFIDEKGKVTDFFTDSFTGGGSCDCDYKPSADGKMFAFCDRIKKSDGKEIKLEDTHKKIAGSFILNNEHYLIIELYEGKPPYRNAKIYRKNGTLVKSFDFQGIQEGLGYTVSKFNSKSGEFIYLLDEPQGIIIALDRKSLEVKRINLADLNVATEQVLNEGEPMYEYTYENQYNLILHDGVFYRISE